MTKSASGNPIADCIENSKPGGPVSRYFIFINRKTRSLHHWQNWPVGVLFQSIFVYEFKIGLFIVYLYSCASIASFALFFKGACLL